MSQPCNRKLSLHRTLFFTIVGIVLAIILALSTLTRRCASGIARLSAKRHN